MAKFRTDVEAPDKSNIIAKFYTFDQNNSGGRFCGPAIKVIVEAFSVKEACGIAEDNGLYFNGVDHGRDCKCCGDRWYTPYKDDGTNEPCIYDTPVEKYLAEESYGWSKGEKFPEVLIIYADGTKKRYFIEE